MLEVIVYNVSPIELQLRVKSGQKKTTSCSCSRAYCEGIPAALPSLEGGAECPGAPLRSAGATFGFD
jgi:hypothetical protein